MLDFRLETFLEVCAHLSFTRAAQALCITQPAVSQHVRYLEEQYGVKLFSYSGKRLSLTPAGEELRRAVFVIRGDDRQLRAALHELAEGKRRVVFGATRTVSAFLLPPYLARFLRKNPGIELTMETGNTTGLLAMLREGRIDFAVVEGNYPRGEYEHRLWCREPFVGVCAAQSPLCAAPHRLEDLLGQTLIVREKGSGTREVLQHALEAENLSVEEFAGRVEIGDMTAIKYLTAAGGGITFLYRAAAAEELTAGTLHELAVPNLHIVHDITLLWRSESHFAHRCEGLFQELFEEGHSKP